MAKVRLHKLLAQAGIASRRRAETMIRAGEVTVGGQVVTELGLQVDPHDDRVEVRGRRVRPELPQYRVLLKPRGCLATLAAPSTDDVEEREKSPRKAHGQEREKVRGQERGQERGKGRETERGTLARFIPDVEVGWQVVAPLDFLAEGVVLLTTDGALAARMSRGGGHVPMTYHLKFQGKIGDAEVGRLLRGWRWDGRLVKPTKVEAIATTGKNTWVEMIVAESRPRVLKAAGETMRHTVLKISRVRLGEISFEGLKMGGFRDVTKKEVKSLLHDAGINAS